MKKKIIVSMLALAVLQTSNLVSAASFSEALGFYNSPAPTSSGGEAGNVSADFQSGLQQGINEGQQICLADPSSCGITVGTVLGDLQFGETEPNDHIISADPLTPLVPMTGQMYSASDEDWYYLETTEINSIIVLSMPESIGIWNVSLLDAGGNLIANSNSLSDAELRLETTVANPGFYYIVIRPTETYTSALYQVTGQIASPVNPDGQLVTTNFHDTETEPNNRFTTADKLASNVTTFGSLHMGESIDIYRIDSNGNETISIDLCWQNSSCADGKAWVMYVFDGKSVRDEDLYQFVDLLPVAPGRFLRNHPYLLANFGLFGDSLIGMIDPSFGKQTRLDLGVMDAGTYYFAISSPLKRDDETASVILKNSTNKTPVVLPNSTEPTEVDTPFIMQFPFSDDQYVFRVTKTQLTPNISAKSVN